MKEEVLKLLKEVFGKMEETVEMQREENLGIDVLMTIHTGFGLKGYSVEGDYYFLPMEEKSQYEIFYGVLNVAQGIVGETFREVEEAVCFINYFLPVGAFVVDTQTNGLMYKSSILMPKSYSPKEAVSLIDATLSVMHHIMDMYVDQWNGLIEGRLTLSQILDSWKNEFDIDMPEE